MTGGVKIIDLTSYELGQEDGLREARNYWFPFGLCLGATLGGALMLAIFWVSVVL